LEYEGGEMKLPSIFLLVILFSAVVAQAEDIDLSPLPDGRTSAIGAPKIIYKKRTKIDFNDAIVEGQVNNPEGIYIVTPPEKQFGSLLKLRPNFHRELIRDSLLMK
jgi:hypothetical protein